MIGARKAYLELLPQKIVGALKTIYDQLDINKCGYIRFEDFLRQWEQFKAQTANAKYMENMALLPHNYTASLRQVTPPNGMLTFERLCAGLRVALATRDMSAPPAVLKSSPTGSANSVDDPAPTNGDMPAWSYRYAMEQKTAGPQKPARRPDLTPTPDSVISDPRPSNEVRRPLSPPVPPRSNENRMSSGYNSDCNYSTYSDLNRIRRSQNDRLIEELRSYQQSEGATRRPMSVHEHLNGQANGHRHQPSERMQRQYETEIDELLKDWRSRRVRNPVLPSTSLSNDQMDRTYRTPVRVAAHYHPNRGAGSLNPPISLIRAKTTLTDQYHSDGNVRKKGPLGQHGSVDELRRSEQQQGVPFKHKRLIFEERDLVRRGQELANMLRDWYGKRISALEKKQKLLTQSNTMPVDHGVQEERLNYLRAHVTELNRRISDLVESADKAFPSCHNLAERSRTVQPQDEDQVNWLRKQNQLLTDELSEKTRQIQDLERERYALMRAITTGNRGPGMAVVNRGACERGKYEATLM